MSVVSIAHDSTVSHQYVLSTYMGVQAYLQELSEEASHHCALQHPYLKALATGNVPDLQWAMTDFARQYYGYSTYFPTFLKAVISRLDCADHREALLQNLDEESGSYPDDDLLTLAKAGIESEWILGIPHPQLFQRFQRAIGVLDTDLERTALEVIYWRNQLLTVLSQGSIEEAIGALGLGTESIVSQCYRPILQALSLLPNLSARDTVFFSMHTLVDDAHQETLLDIAADLAVTPEGQSNLRKGMLAALDLRAKFWDWMYERALTQGGVTA
ncbi:MAG: iron-containing redox enzyme family protein [Cyanobacteria bacterium P01_D01_bin.156]